MLSLTEKYNDTIKKGIYAYTPEKIDINKIIVFHARDSYYDNVRLNPNFNSQSYRNCELKLS